MLLATISDWFTQTLPKDILWIFNQPMTLFIIGMSLLGLFFWYFATEIERRKRNVGTVLLFGICGLCALAIVPPKERLKAGIDIQGGSAFTLRIQPKDDGFGNPTPITPEQVEQAIAVISKRLDEYGTAEPQIAGQGNDTILVQMPGITPEESNRVQIILEKVAKLELREVHRDTDQPGPDGKTLAERVLAGAQIVPGYQAFPEKKKSEDGRETDSAILLRKQVALTGKNINQATPSMQRPDAVDIVLNGEGTDKMIALTKGMERGRDRIAIVLDGGVKSAPVVQQTPLGKDFQITGLNDAGETQGLANALMNPLENPLEVIASSKVSPTLGSSVVAQGLLAGMLSLVATFLLVFVYYRFSGLVAIVGLIVNTIILFGVMALLGFTFTLPGIAGMILTIGMAVDANVLIYERLREEIAAGKALKNAIEASYERAFSAIFDSHVTSLITAVILFWLGEGAIKGFAITLTIGVTASLFSAILVTRVIFRWGTDFNWIKKLSFLDLIKATKYDFLGKRRIAIFLAVATIVMSVAAFAIRGEKCLGIDFTGGTRITFELGKDPKVTLDEVKACLETLKAGGTLTKEPTAQQETTSTGTVISVRCASDNPAKNVTDTTQIINKLRTTIPALGEKSNQTRLAFVLGKNSPLKLTEVETALAGLKSTLSQGATAKQIKDPTEGALIAVNCNAADAETLKTKLPEVLPAIGTKVTASTPYAIDSSADTVSSLIGNAFMFRSLLAIMLGFVGIVIYMTFRFEFSFALGGFIAIFHDVIICVGLVVMMGGQLSLIHVGAVLTIAGYSISDTIVVFDRVRETLLYRTDSVQKIMNDAICATLSRTLLTSGATLVSVAILSWVGGAALRDFGVIIFLGIIIGTFSSIFIASPIVLWWSGRKGGNLRDDVLSTTQKELLAMNEVPQA